MKSRQSGFTLVEIAIVLVIIGLLLGGILKGQELINSGKVKALASEFRAISTAYYAYQDRFRAVPGDDQNVGTANHLPNATVATTPAGATLGNGRINGDWLPGTPASDESSLAWQHMRMANLLAGATVPAANATYLPVNAVGGLMGITGVNPISGATGATFVGSVYICSNAIDGAVARKVDATLDDGDGTTGSVRAMVAGVTTQAAGQAYVDGTAVVICMAQ